MASRPLKFKCVPVHQGVGNTLYLFSASAKTLWSVVQIATRDADKDDGYQRFLSPARRRAIAKYISAGNPIPTSILISFGDAAKVNSDGTELTVKSVADAGWVIDGQHRLAGAHEASVDIELPVVAFLGLDTDSQIEQFVTINREAKGVPTSLYYDLLSHLPKKSPAEIAKERAADLASELKKDEASPFHGRIVVTTSPKKGELSLNNFVRKIYPLLLDGRALHLFTLQQQAGILLNYYSGLKVIFPQQFSRSSMFFQTLGFGALINALPTALQLCINNYKSFRVEDVAKLFRELRHFDFNNWESIGTGTAAENQAGDDLKQEMLRAFETEGDGGAKTINLGL